jgi:hypothetical protein
MKIRRLMTLTLVAVVMALLGTGVHAAFMDNDNGTVSDTSTGLIWQQDTARDGQGNYDPMTWEEALAYCESRTLGGHTDWRLPTIKELLSLVDYTRYNPAMINTTYFLNTVSSYYWSSTTYAKCTYYAWGVDFSDGHVLNSGSKCEDYHYYVRAVRGGLSPKPHLSIFSIGPYYPNGKEKYQDASAESVNMVNLWKCYAESFGYTFSSKLFNRHINPSSSCDDILEMIKQQANSLSAKDVFVFSFTGHGLKNELIVGYDGSKECAISAYELYEALKRLANKGVKLYVLLDACHSGSFKDELDKLGNKDQVHIYMSAGEDSWAWRICTPDGLWISGFNYAYYIIAKSLNNLGSCIPLIGSWEHNCPVLEANVAANQFFPPFQDDLNQANNWEEQIAIALADLNNMPGLIGSYIYNQYGDEGVMAEELWDPGYQPGILKVLYVHPDGSCAGKLPCYSTIQGAIDAAADGDSVLVCHGDYNESIVLDKAKSLKLLCGRNDAFEPSTLFSTVSAMHIGKGAVIVEGLCLSGD